MRLTRTTIGWVVAFALLSMVLASGSFALEVRRVWLSDRSQYGWNKYTTSSPKAKADFSNYYTTCKGSPGPSPVGSFYMQGPVCDSAPTGGAWFGTDVYQGMKLSNITALKYWAIVDYKGQEGSPTLDGNGNPMPYEWKPKYLPSQPPQLCLSVKLADGNLRTLIFRPWTATYPGFGPREVANPASATPPAPWRRWMEYDCLFGYWMQEEGGSPVDTWNNIVNSAKFLDATLESPVKSSGMPVWGSHQSPLDNGAGKSTSLCFELGARASANPDFPLNYQAWWYESYGAYAAIDKFTIAGLDKNQSVFEHEYDFQSPGNTGDPSNNKIRALNNRAIFDQEPYVPAVRTRNWPGGPGSCEKPAWWWGNLDLDCGTPPVTIFLSMFNAIQRAGNYNTNTPATCGQLFVLYGRVTDFNGSDLDLFKVDDGAGQNVDCYCPGAINVLGPGQYVRMVGTIYGQCPYDWYYNTFHVVKWNADPNLYEYSHLWPYRFDTYPWQVTVLEE